MVIAMKSDLCPLLKGASLGNHGDPTLRADTAIDAALSAAQPLVMASGRTPPYGHKKSLYLSKDANNKWRYHGAW
jgi:hypothetical protein